MFLDKINEEFQELSEIIGDETLNILHEIIQVGKYIRKEDLLDWNRLIRGISRSEALLGNKEFKTEIASFYSERFIMCAEDLFGIYDNLAHLFKMKQEEIVDTKQMYGALYDSISNLSIIIEKINMASELITEIIQNTWEPLPNEAKKENIEDIIISSETRSMSLNDVSSDIGNLDSFLKNVCLLIKENTNQSNNIYLRRVETGSLTIAVSCAMQVGPIIGFMFWCIKLYQKAEKRHLDNEKKKLELINDSMHIAKEILGIDPDNKEAEEIIQKCGIHVLDFLKNNPTGIINGERYDIGIEKLKIEDKGENN